MAPPAQVGPQEVALGLALEAEEEEADSSPSKALVAAVPQLVAVALPWEEASL